MPEPTRTAAIFSLGDELVLGQTLDTNSAWLSDRLTALGVRIIEHTTVADDFDAIADAFARLVGTVDLIVTTGGLGPTTDDLTRDVLAEVAGEDLVEDPEALGWVRGWFRGRGHTMPANNAVQALRPRSARCLRNDQGTAPALITRIGGRAGSGTGATDVLCLPGPPRELMPIFEREIGAIVRADPAFTIATRTLPTFGMGESAVAERLGGVMARDRNPLVGTTASRGVVTCRLRYQGPPGAAEGALDKTEREVRERLGPIVLRTGGAAESLAEVVLDLLRARSQTLCTVESCTGGMLGEELTTPAGASDVYLGGFVTYTNALKSSLVGVPPDLLDEHGAVSAPVARAMALGGLERTGADHALAITGVAGPSGGTPDKPVGTVWIALASRAHERPDVRRFRFGGDRANVRAWSARAAMGMVRLRLMGEDMTLLGEVDRG